MKSTSTELANVALQVPFDRLPEFHRLMARFYESGPEVERTEWSRADGKAAEELYMDLSPFAREVFDMLLKNPEGLTVDALAETFNVKPSQIRGALSWPTSYAKEAGKPPIHRMAEDGKRIYIPGPVAQVFKQALRRK